METFTLSVATVVLQPRFAVLISAFESAAEQRRKKHGKQLRSWRVTSSPITEADADAWQAFYEARSGPFETFSWESPIDEVTYTVRFGEGSYAQTFGGGVRTCAATFVEVV